MVQFKKSDLDKILVRSAGLYGGFDAPSKDYYYEGTGDEDQKKKDEEEKKKEEQQRSLLEEAANFVAGGSLKLFNTAGAGLGGAIDLGKIGLDQVFNQGKDYEKLAQEAERNLEERLAPNAGFAKSGTFFEGRDDPALQNAFQGGDAGRFATRVAGAGLDVGSELGPGALVKAAARRGVESTGKALVRGAVEGAGFGAMGSAGSQLSTEGEIDAGRLAADTALGTAFGSAFGLGGRYLAKRKADKQAAAAGAAGAGAVAADAITDPTRLLGAGDDTLRSRLSEIDDEIAAYQRGDIDPNSYTPTQKNMGNLGSDRLETGQITSPEMADWQRGLDELVQTRDELTAQQAGLMDDAAYTQAYKNLEDNYNEEIARIANVPPIRQQALEQRIGEKYQQAINDLDDQFLKSQEDGPKYQGMLADIDNRIAEQEASMPQPSPVATLSSENIGVRGQSLGKAEYLRGLMRERKTIEQQLSGLKSLEETPHLATASMKTDIPVVKRAIDSELQAVETALMPEKPTGKVNALVDYFRTPTAVLRKIGLGQTARTVEKAFEGYRLDLNKQVNVIKQWQARLPEKESSQKIFNWLDGDKNVALTPEESKVAGEMKDYLKEWADKLGIPEEKRVSDYITHIFEKDFDGNVVDPTLAQIISNRPANKVYNPYTEKRIGGKGYKEDVFAALDAYARRGTRQYHMDPALKVLSDSTKNVDDRTARYLQRLNERIAMRPDRVDQLVDDVVSSVTGDKFGPRAGTRALQGWRNTIYRGTLGLNIGSAVRNLTQSTNTFAELGFRDTIAGYSQLMRNLGQSAGQKIKGQGDDALDELRDAGILDDSLVHQDQTVSAMKQGLQNVDKGLWAMFDTAELLNRGSAYYGAKSQFLRKNPKATEEEAKQAAIDMVGKTQFRFNDVETPLALRNQVVKTLTQFQSFNVKQSEYLLNMTKGAIKNPKEMAKVIRWVGANLAVAASVGEILGIKWYSSIPNFLDYRGITSPTVDLVSSGANLAQGKNEFGQETDRVKLAETFGRDVFRMLAPGGTQIDKTIQGTAAVESGASRTDSGNVRYGIETNDENRLRGALFGQYALDEGQDYFDRGGKPLSADQSAAWEAAPAELKPQVYDYYNAVRGANTERETASKKITELIRGGEVNRARRVAEEFNQTIDDRLSDFMGKYQSPDRELLREARSLKIRLTDSSIRSRKRSEE
jgi:hypothetical protein